MHAAKLVVAGHGSALTNAVWMQPGSVLIEIFPHAYADPLYRSMTTLLGNRYGMGLHVVVLYVWNMHTCPLNMYTYVAPCVLIWWMPHVVVPQSIDNCSHTWCIHHRHFINFHCLFFFTHSMNHRQR